MSRPGHRKHTWRSISKSADGSVELLGCSYRGCVETKTQSYGIGQFSRRPDMGAQTQGGKR
jgi:hypothetical protein